MTYDGQWHTLLRAASAFVAMLFVTQGCGRSNPSTDGFLSDANLCTAPDTSAIEADITTYKTTHLLNGVNASSNTVRIGQKIETIALPTKQYWGAIVYLSKESASVRGGIDIKLLREPGSDNKNFNHETKAPNGNDGDFIGLPAKTISMNDISLTGSWHTVSFYGVAAALYTDSVWLQMYNYYDSTDGKKATLGVKTEAKGVDLYSDSTGPFVIVPDTKSSLVLLECAS